MPEGDGGCPVVCFTGPLARLPEHLATLRRTGLALRIRRCRTLLDFARELKACAGGVAAIDCGPGNLRLAEAVGIYRRAGSALPLVLLGEQTQALREAVAGLGRFHTLAPDDLAGLAARLRAACGVATPSAGWTPAADAQGAAAPRPRMPVADRSALLEELHRALVGNAAHAVLAVIRFDLEPADAARFDPAPAIAGAFDSTAAPAALGEGRFGILLALSDPAAGVGVAHAARERLLAWLRGLGPTRQPSVALGLSPPRASDGTDATAWLQRAVAACEVAQRTEHGYAVLDRRPVTIPTAQDLPSLIREALVGDGLLLLFQPVVSLRGDAREHYETLVRLPSPTAGELLPGDFFGAAQTAGLMSALDQWVIRHAIRRLAAERRRNRRIHLFIPLSAQGLADPQLLVTVCDELRDAQASGDWLTFQLRPADVRAHPARTKALVHGLRQIRCSLALDRYDAEPASREVLGAMTVDFAKLPPALVRNLRGAPARQERLVAIVTQLHARGVKSVATGVEDAEGLASLWTAGIDYAQGFFLQEPSEVIAYDAAP